MIGDMDDAASGAELFGEDFLIDEVIFHQKNVIRGACEFGEDLWRVCRNCGRGRDGARCIVA